MTLGKAMDFVLTSRIELALVGSACLVAGSASAFAPAMYAGWAVLALLLPAALAADDTH